MAPDIGELKLLAAALKMDSAFVSVDKLARQWIDGGWKDLNPEDLEEDQKRDWYDLHDSYERAAKDLRGKLLRFEQDPYAMMASPILRYERVVDSYGVKGKLFLGINSHQAKGYRIVELNYPRWLEDLMKTDSDVFFSDNLSEGEVYALVPSRELDQEKLSVLRNDFWDEMEKAGVPAFESIPGVEGKSKKLKDEFSSRLKKRLISGYRLTTMFCVYRRSRSRLNVNMLWLFLGREALLWVLHCRLLLLWLRLLLRRPLAVS